MWASIHSISASRNKNNISEDKKSNKYFYLKIVLWLKRYFITLKPDQTYLIKIKGTFFWSTQEKNGDKESLPDTIS